MSLRDSIKFQKTLALAAAASNPFEAAAAELAARRLMESCNIDPTRIPDGSLYGRMPFADNPLLKKLRDEWREQHPVPDLPIVEEEEPRRRSRSLRFSIEKFVRANQRRKVTRTEPRRPVSEEDIERIRVMLNNGCSYQRIAQELKMNVHTVNTQRFRHYTRDKKWVRDDRKQYQWATDSNKVPRDGDG